ncbi:MAG: DUF2059 domain-containing protein [Candidatus Hydrogenedentota bacterium]
MKHIALAGALIAAALATATGVLAQTNPETDPHRAAAMELTELLHMDELIQQSYEEMVDVQIRGNPELRGYREVMLAFFREYMSWEILRADITGLYVEAFTEAELRELILFYSSPVGQKAVDVMPELMRRGTEIGTRRVQQHLPELERLIQEAQAERSRQP